MCELLVRVVDKVNAADPYADARCTRRGDVIAVQPDAWVWGHREQLDVQWRILAVPGVPVIAMESLLAPEPETDPENPSRMLQARAFGLDLGAFDAETRAWLAEPNRGLRPVHRVNLTTQQLLDMRIRKAPLPDPNIL